MQHLETEITRIERELETLVKATAPQLLDVYGCGVHSAALLFVAAGDNPDRLRSEAAWAHLCGTAPIPRVVGQGDALPLEPRRRPASQPCATSHRHRAQCVTIPAHACTSHAAAPKAERPVRSCAA